MAISVSHLTLGSSTSADPSTASIDPSSGAVVLAWIGASDSFSTAEERIPDLLSISGGGATWTKVHVVPWRLRRRSWLYVGTGWTGGADTIDLVFAGSPAQDPAQWVWIIDEATGLDETTPYSGLGIHYEEEDTDTTCTPASTDTPDTGDFTYSAMHLENNRTSLAASGFTALGETAIGTHGVRRSETGYSSSGASSAPWTWDASAQGISGAIITLNAAGGSPPATVTGSPAIMGACF